MVTTSHQLSNDTEMGLAKTLGKHDQKRAIFLDQNGWNHKVRKLGFSNCNLY